MNRTAALLILFAATGQDWPGWRGAGRDGKVADFNAPATWPKTLERGWSVEVGGGHSTPALVEGRLYVHARQAEDEVVLCLDAATGKEIWRDRIAAPYKPAPDAEKFGKGPFSSPAVSGGRVFTLGISGILSCLDAKTGKVLWRHETAAYPEWGASMSPLVVGDMCVVHVGGKGKGAIVAFEAADGKTRWRWEGDGPGYASPVVATIGGKIQLITQTQSYAVGLAAVDGKLLWQMEYKTDYEQNTVTPVVHGNSAILSGYKNGVTAWRLDGPQPVQAWQSDEVSMYMSTAVLKGDSLYGFSEKRRGQFFCLDAKSGKALWIGDGRQGDNAALLDAGGVILALTNASQLIVFDASDKAYVERARYKVAETPTWAHPVVGGKAIFVKDANTLTRWTLP